METKDAIYIVVTTAEPKIHSRKKISEGSKMVCKAQIRAEAGMFSSDYKNQIEKMRVGSRVIILQGGYAMYRKKYGAVRLIAAGVVKGNANKLQSSDIFRNLELWMTMRKWYKNWPTANNSSDELIVHYNLRKARSPLPKPKEIIMNPKTKVLELKPNTSVYEKMDEWWRDVTKQWYY